MKNVHKLMAVFFAAVLLSGCATKAFVSTEKYLEFVGNPTTGYTWILSNSNEDIVFVEEDIKYMGKDDIVGAPSMFFYKFISQKPGESIVKFEYKRPWEEKEAQNIRTYKVIVKESGKMSLKEL